MRWSFFSCIFKISSFINLCHTWAIQSQLAVLLNTFGWSWEIRGNDFIFLKVVKWRWWIFGTMKRGRDRVGMCECFKKVNKRNPLDIEMVKCVIQRPLSGTVELSPSLHCHLKKLSNNQPLLHFLKLVSFG